MFKRILKSSRAKESIAVAIAVTVVAALGWDDGREEAITVTLMAVWGLLAAVWSYGTAKEDAAQKRAGVTIDRESNPVPITGKPGPSIPRPKGVEPIRPIRDVAKILCLLMIPVSCLMVSTAGCSFLAPGHDVRQASEAKSWTHYDADTLQIEEATTHNRRTVLAEGESVDIEYYADGSPKKIIGGTHVLTQWSQPTDAMGAYTELANLNAQIGLRMMDALDRVLAVLPAGGVSVEASGQVDVREPQAVQRDAD